MRTIITAAIAAVILAAGAFAATAVVGSQATAQESDEIAPLRHDRPGRGAILEETLAELVADDIITRAQADAISEALAAKAEEYKDEIQQWREEHRDQIRDGKRRAFRLGQYLEDGVIDSAELDEIMEQVPDDHWLKDPDGPAAKYLADDQVTADELRQLHEELRDLRQAEKGDASAAPAEPTGAQV